MRWFRTNRGVCGRLALFALALQLFLSFGHIHRENIFGNSPAHAVAAEALPAPDGSAPQGQKSHHADDYCAICATVSLLSHSFVAAAPQFAVLLAARTIEHGDRVAAALITPRHFFFQSRAPPLA